MILFIVRQSNQIEARRLEIGDDGRVREVEPPDSVPAEDVVIIQPYGSLFFAAAPVFEKALPTVTEETVHSVVIIRLRGKSEVGATLIDHLTHYAGSLHDANSKLMLVTDSSRIRTQLDVAGATQIIGEDNIYAATEWLTETVRQAKRDAEDWIAAQRRSGAEESDT